MARTTLSGLGASSNIRISGTFRNRQLRNECHDLDEECIDGGAMTLNITVVSGKEIYQSADFRLAEFTPARDGTYIPMVGNFPKIVSLRYRNWWGYLSYCGVGRWDNRQTYEAAAEWIVSLGSEITFEEVASALASRGSDWINDVQSKLGRFQAHTFVLGAFCVGAPSLALISNTHSTTGSLVRSIGAGLKVSYGEGRDTHVYVTGLDGSVLKAERIGLKRMVEKGFPSNVIRNRLALTNENAASRKEARNGISSSCMCYSIDSLGGGNGEVYGPVSGRFEPVQIVNGVNLTEALKAMGISGPAMQIRGTAFATSASSNAVAVEHIDCVLDLKVSEGRPAVAAYDLGDINAMNIEIASANKNGSIVGQLRRPVGVPPRAFLWIPHEEIVDLGTLGGATSGAKDVNVNNVVVGFSTTHDNLSKAFLWKKGNMLDLGAAGGNNSSASGINDLGVVVGEAYISPAAPQEDLHRAFRWTEARGMELIPETASRWSRAMKINNNGQVLGHCYLTTQVGSFVWSDIEGLQLIEGTPGRPFYASAINDYGVVVGEADDEHGVRRGMRWTLGRGLQVLQVPFSFSPTAIDNSGNIVGHDIVRPWSAAWLLRADGELIRLPAGRDHNVDARAINGESIFGHARGNDWKHVHPMRWDISQQSPQSR
jgi:probable HAF family extracellular repeat protein